MSILEKWKEAPEAEDVILATLLNAAPGESAHATARKVYTALADCLPVYEDVYSQCCEVLEPHVRRYGRAGGTLPASVVESLTLLLEHWDKQSAEGLQGRTRAEARQRLVTQAISRAAVHTPFSLENLTACGVFSGTPANAIACELAEQVLELQDRLSRLNA